ncbi:MAG: HPr kinase/phosphorylase, partial [Deltaproteobacteria bacterium]|nr:HPr kinase/phosphorylase [Deltaproteobacteria bacterium]
MGAPVKEFLEGELPARLCLTLVAGGGGLDREVTTSLIQKPGLLLTGILEELHSDRVQVFGAAEVGYLTSLSEEKLRMAMAVLEKPELPAIIVTRALEPPGFLLELCARKDIPLFKSTLTSSVFIERVTKFLEGRLAPTTTLHGVLMDLLGVGVLIIGKSGIGKSECALELVSRGYRLVSDDVVI